MRPGAPPVEICHFRSAPGKRRRCSWPEVSEVNASPRPSGRRRLALARRLLVDDRHRRAGRAQIDAHDVGPPAICRVRGCRPSTETVGLSPSASGVTAPLPSAARRTIRRPLLAGPCDVHALLEAVRHPRGLDIRPRVERHFGARPAGQVVDPRSRLLRSRPPRDVRRRDHRTLQARFRIPHCANDGPATIHPGKASWLPQPAAPDGSHGFHRSQHSARGRRLARETAFPSAPGCRAREAPRCRR